MLADESVNNAGLVKAAKLSLAVVFTPELFKRSGGIETEAAELVLFVEETELSPSEPLVVRLMDNVAPRNVAGSALSALTAT